ncbi:solute carrier family 46 member 3-like [Patella vulgata]|uniref:solute carrier family 46 member 3-like n=1 Tax=Patella vulgata TaxID=6465 RepID=UPI00217F5420|nr:solute carrier family 46 member 3-like [Patella vulgata]
MVFSFCPKQTVFAGLVFFLYKAGESMLDATIRPYIIQAVCRNRYRDNVTICYDASIQSRAQEEDIQSTASNYLIYYRILVNVPAIILGLVWGAWSDRHGRKLPMMIPSLGSVLTVLLYVGSLQSVDWNLVLILCGSAVQGIFGKSSVITTAVNSYVSDITDKDDRTGSLSRLLAMNYFGLFVGSLLSGALQDYTDLQTTLTVVCFLHAFSVLTTIGFINNADPTTSTERRYGSLCRVCTPTELRESLTVHLTVSKVNPTRVFTTLVFIALMNQTCKVGDQDVTVLFVKKHPLKWPTPWYGYLLALDYTVMGATLMILTPVLSTYGKVPDTVIVIIGVCCKVVRSLWAGFCYQSWMVFASVLIGAVGGMIISAVRSLVSKNVDDSDMGKAFAVLACAETASKVIGSIVFNYVYGATIHVFACAAYLMEAIIYMFVLAIAVCLHKDLKLSSEYDVLKGYGIIYKD